MAVEYVLVHSGEFEKSGRPGVGQFLLPGLPPTNTGNIPFWWDILTVAGFSLIIWFWAMRTKLPREEMLLLVNKQASHGDEPMPDVHH